jgi:uncharacterized membrane protein
VGRLLANMSARGWLTGMLVVGVCVWLLSGFLYTWRYAPLIGWDAAAAFYTAGVWFAIIPMDSDSTHQHAGREDPTRTLTGALILAASLASLVAVGVVLVAASSKSGSTKGFLTALAAGSVAISWLLLHTLFTLRYAVVFFRHGNKGVDFNQKEAPRYSDFAYLAFTIGMTFQVSDTDLTTHQMRTTAIRHALLSYLFGAVILATTVNFIVSLSS